MCPGVNIFIGENATGKTDLLKVAYAACDITKTKISFAEKLVRVFLPYRHLLGRLVQRTGKSTTAVVEISRADATIRTSFTNDAKEPESAKTTGTQAGEYPRQGCTRGRVLLPQEQRGKLEFTLLAEGLRKVALLWLLIQNGTLVDGSVLFWDEPEANLNPGMLSTVAEILLALQRMGVQVRIATHDYVLVKELDLRMKDGDRVCSHALYRDEGGTIRHAMAPTLAEIAPNAIVDTFVDLYRRDAERALGQASR